MSANPAEPRAWTYKGVEFVCRCAPFDVWDANPDGFACQPCRRLLPDRSLMRPLVCDMWCCWCGGLAEGQWGYRIYGHPEKALAAPHVDLAAHREDT